MELNINYLIKVATHDAIITIAEAKKRAKERPIGERRIDIGFYDNAKDRLKPLPNIRWSAVLVKWDGNNWARIKRLSGPSEFEVALSDVTRIASQRELKRV